MLYYHQIPVHWEMWRLRKGVSSSTCLQKIYIQHALHPYLSFVSRLCYHSLCVRVCLSVCVYVCMEAVCVCVCPTCLWNKNVLVCPQTDIWPCPIGHRGLQTSSLCLFTLAHSAPLPLANDPGGHIHSVRQEAHPGYFLCIKHLNSEKKHNPNIHRFLVFHRFKAEKTNHGDFAEDGADVNLIFFYCFSAAFENDSASAEDGGRGLNPADTSSFWDSSLMVPEQLD